ncbi:hypothetical protein LRC537489_06230 [Mycobacterium riyadhense]
MFSYLNAGKASLSLTPDSDRYRVELATADVVVVTAGRSRAPGLGIDPSRLLADNPRAVIVTISDFGWSGPFADRAATEFTLQAWAGGGGGGGGPPPPPPPARLSPPAATSGSTWAACSPRSGRWPCAAASSAADRVSISTWPCSRRSR